MKKLRISIVAVFFLFSWVFNFEQIFAADSGFLGDLNGDKIVNSIDFSILNGKWLTSDVSADLNNDQIVNSLDFSIMNQNWLKSSDSVQVILPTPIPTPPIQAYVIPTTKQDVDSYLRNNFGAKITTPGAVVVIPSPKGPNNPGIVILPDGNPLNIQGTRTAGLQEAFDYARAKGWDVFVYGRGKYDISNTNGKYILSDSLRFPSLQGKTIRIYDADLYFDESVKEAGMHFDSTMMVDIRHTGKIEAPYAKYGIFFDPEKPLPLDGPIYGAIGIASSRFAFGDVSSKEIGVYLETTNSVGQPASLNGTEFYFKSIFGGGVSQSMQVAGIYSSNSIVYQTPILDKVPFVHDIFDPNAVVVLPPENSLSTSRAFLPDGSFLNVSGSKTSGIQEAINYAVANNLNLIVYGRGIQHEKLFFTQDNKLLELPGFTDGFYFVRASLVFPNMSNKVIKFFNVTIDDSAKDASDVDALMRFTGGDSLDVEVTGQLVNRKSSVSFKIEPQTMDVTNSLFRFGHGSTGMLSTYFKSIRDSRIHFTELLGSDVLGAFGDNAFGLRIMTPRLTESCFCNNRVIATLIHGHEHLASHIGHVADNSNNINNNTFVLGVSSDNADQELGVQLWGDSNRIYFNVVGTKTQRGMTIDAVAENNIIQYTKNDALLEKILDASGGKNIIQQVGLNSWF